MAAGIATLTELRKPGKYTLFEHKGQLLVDGITKAIYDAQIPVQIVRFGAMFCLYFNSEPVTNYTQAKRSDTARFAHYFWDMLAQGIYLPPSQYESCFISLALEDTMLEETIQAVDHALRQKV